MKHLSKFLLLTLLILSICGTMLASLHTYALGERLAEVRRESHSEAIYLRARIRELEATLRSELREGLEAMAPAETTPSAPVGGEGEGESETATEAETATETDGDILESEAETEAVTAPETAVETEPETETETERETERETESETLPIPETPETTPEAPPPTVETELNGGDGEVFFPTALYIIGEHKGRIGVFDATGTLLRTVNVFVMTLPRADREALAVGIAVYSPEEVEEVVGRYE